MSLTLCPCGGEAETRVLVAVYRCCCKQCGAKTPRYDTPAQAEAAWRGMTATGDGEIKQWRPVYECNPQKWYEGPEPTHLELHRRTLYASPRSDAAQERVAKTCKDRGGQIGAMGECLECSAESGVACRRGERRPRALSAADWKADHPRGALNASKEGGK
jgi:hypothetical protein